MARSTRRLANASDLPRVQRFLEDNRLPTTGIEKCIESFVIEVGEDGSLIGVAGMELYGESCLLRSVAVDKRFRRRGHGRSLVNSVLKNAKAKGANTAYLLTEDAIVYFARLGFVTVDRADVDEPVKTSPEFTECCCETAVTMRKDLQNG